MPSEFGGVLHAERLVRTLGVVALAEVVELGRLLKEVLRRWRGGFLLQGQVHALVAAILLGMAGLDTLDSLRLVSLT